MADFRDRYALARLLARGWVRKETSVPQSEASFPTCLPRHEWNRHLTAEVADDGASAFSGEAGTRKQKRSVDFVAIQLPRVVLKEEQLQSESLTSKRLQLAAAVRRRAGSKRFRG